MTKADQQYIHDLEEDRNRLAHAAALLLLEADDDGITSEGVTRMIEAIESAMETTWRHVATAARLSLQNGGPAHG